MRKLNRLTNPILTPPALGRWPIRKESDTFRAMGLFKRLSDYNKRYLQEQTENVIRNAYSKAYGPLPTDEEMRSRRLKQQFLAERAERLSDELFERMANMSLSELTEYLDATTKKYRTFEWTAELMTEHNDNRRRELIQIWRGKMEKSDPSEFQPEIVFTNQQIQEEFYAWNRNRSAQIQREYDSQQSPNPLNDK